MILKNMFSKHNFMVSKKSFLFNKPEYEGLVYNLSLNLTLFENVLDLKSNYQDISLILINKDNPSGLNKFKKILNEEENFAKKVILFGTSSEEDWRYPSYLQIPFNESNLFNTIYNGYLLYYKVNSKNYENNLLFYESENKFINIFKKTEGVNTNTSLLGLNHTIIDEINLDSDNNDTPNINPHIEHFLLEKEEDIPVSNNTNNTTTNNNSTSTNTTYCPDGIDSLVSLETLNTLISPSTPSSTSLINSISDNPKDKLSKYSTNPMKTNLDSLNIHKLPIEEFKINLDLNDEQTNPSSSSSLDDKEINENENEDDINFNINNDAPSNCPSSSSLLEFDFNQIDKSLNEFNLNTLNDPVKQTDKEKSLNGGMGMSALNVNFDKLNEEINQYKETKAFKANQNGKDTNHDDFTNFSSVADENGINNFSSSSLLSLESFENTQEDGLNFDLPLMTDDDNIDSFTNDNHEDVNVSNKNSPTSLNHLNDANNINTIKNLSTLEFDEKLHQDLNQDGLAKEYYDRDDIRDDKELAQTALEQIRHKVKEGDEDYDEFLRLHPELLNIDNSTESNPLESELNAFNDLMLERQKLSNSKHLQASRLSSEELESLDEELKAYNINKLTLLNQISQARQLCDSQYDNKREDNETCAEIIFDDPYEQEKHIFFINFETFELYTNFELKLINDLSKNISNYVDISLCHQALTQNLKVNCLKNKIYYLNNLAVSNQTFHQSDWQEAKSNLAKQGFYRNNLISFIMVLTYLLDPNPRLFQEIDVNKRYNLNLTPLLKNLYSKDIQMLKWAIGMYQKSFMLSALQSIKELDLEINEKEFVQFINTSYLLGFLDEVAQKDKEKKGLFNKIKKIF